MNRRFWLAGPAVAAALALTAGVARAQQQPAQPAQPNQPPQPGQVIPSPVTGNQFTFVPGFGFVPTTQLAVMNPAFFNPAFFPGFVPGFAGNPFFVATTPFFFGGPIPLTFYPGPLTGTPNVVATRPSVVPPILGVNTPPQAIPRQSARVPEETVATVAGTATPGGVTELELLPAPDVVAQARVAGAQQELRQQVAGLRQETRERIARTRETGTQRVAGARQEFRPAPAATATTLLPPSRPSAEERVALQRAETLMLNDRPLTEGRVQKVGATGVTVEYTVDGQTRVERFPMEEVFFFRESGEMVTAAASPELVTPGARVLVPLRPERITAQQSPPVRERVAGVRQTVRTRTAGARATVRARRPAR